jgi:hypothetical protein
MTYRIHLHDRPCLPRAPSSLPLKLSLTTCGRDRYQGPAEDPVRERELDFSGAAAGASAGVHLVLCSCWMDWIGVEEHESVGGSKG